LNGNIYLENKYQKNLSWIPTKAHEEHCIGVRKFKFSHTFQKWSPTLTWRFDVQHKGAGQSKNINKAEPDAVWAR
jgi:hypothetical protein